MGKYEIPEPFVWDESFRVFYENLDAEHKGLFTGIFAVANERDNDAVLASLKEKVSAHFATEEAMMAKASYDNLADHKALHEKFVSDLAAVNIPVNEDTLIFAKDWLVNHIKDIDFQYKEKL